MTWKHLIKTALRALRTNKSRSLLTILGIVIGVTAIILIASLGKGAQDLILSQIQGMGSRTVIVLPGRQPKGPSDSAQLFSDSLKVKDLEQIKKKSNVPTAETIVPIVFGAESGSYENETYRLTIFGVSPEIQEVFDLAAGDGAFFNEDDVRAKASVVVLGERVKRELFGDGDAVGQRIKMKGHSFRVVGVLPKKGQVSFFNFDEVAIIPYTTAQDYIFGVKYFHRIIVTANSDDSIETTAFDITATLREAHNITDPEKDDFHIETQAELAKTLSVITDVFTMFLASVAGISLFVAGVGIMNIMLVSVTERTREIGLRKALGATEKDILYQFLIEAVTLTAAGGLIGIILGASFSFAASTALSQGLGLAWTFSFPWGAALVGIIVSGLIGLLFGLYPARQASRKSPMEALRYE